MRKKKSEEASSEEPQEEVIESGESEVSEETEDSGISEEPQRQTWKIKCSDCGKDAEVPFEPTEGRAVYCRDCFMKHRKPRRNFGRRRF